MRAPLATSVHNEAGDLSVGKIMCEVTFLREKKHVRNELSTGKNVLPLYWHVYVCSDLSVVKSMCEVTFLWANVCVE